MLVEDGGYQYGGGSRRQVAAAAANGHHRQQSISLYDSSPHRHTFSSLFEVGFPAKISQFFPPNFSVPAKFLKL